MKKKSFLICFCILSISCIQQFPEQQVGCNEGEGIAKTKNACSRFCEKKRMADGFTFYSSEDRSRKGKSGYSVIEKKVLQGSFKSGKKNKSSSRWEIINVNLTDSTDLGYTFCNWTLTTQTPEGKDTTIYRNYLTLIKRQADGSWKPMVESMHVIPVNKLLNS